MALSRFLDELPFWGITGEVRPSIYAAINGVVLYDNLGDPEEYSDFIEGIGIELNPIADFTNAINERYCRLKSDLDGRSVPNSGVVAFLHVVEDFSQQIASKCEDAEIHAWCGVFFAMGMYGAHSNNSLAADLLAKWQARQHIGETHLLEYVRNVGLQLDFMDEEDPMDRFLGRCYPTTPYESKFITKRVLPQVEAEIKANKSGINLDHFLT